MMAAGRLYTFTAGDDDAYAAVFDFFADDAFHFLHVLRQGHDDADMFRSHAYALADLFETSCSGRVLAAGHGCGQVVGDDDCDVGVFVDGIKQACHAGVCKRGVTDDSHRGELSGVGCAFGHRDGSAHVDHGVCRGVHSLGTMRADEARQVRSAGTLLRLSARVPR